MATEVQRPNADGPTLEFTPLSGTDHFAMVNESVADDDTSYITTPGGGQGQLTDLFDFDWSAIGNNDTIQQIDVAYRAKLGANGSAGTDDIRAVMFDGATTSGGTIQDLTTSYQDFNHSFTLLLPDDGADLKNNYTFGVRAVSNNLGSDDVRVTRVEVTVTYTAVVVVPEDAFVASPIPMVMRQVVGY